MAGAGSVGRREIAGVARLLPGDAVGERLQAEEFEHARHADQEPLPHGAQASAR